MRHAGLIFLCSCAAAALLGALTVTGCNNSNNSGALPAPSLAPTLPPGTVTEYPVPTANATPFGIALGSDDNMWFTEASAGKVGIVTPSGSFTEIALPGGGASNPEDIVSGPNGNIWFVETGDSKIGTINVGSHALAEYSTPTANSDPTGLAVDPNGSQLWFGEFNLSGSTGKIGKVTTSGSITEYPTYAGSEPTAIAVTNDGTIWFLDNGSNTLDSMTFPGPVVNEYSMPVLNGGSVAGLAFLTIGPDNNLWFTAYGALSVGVDAVCSADPAVTPPTSECFTPPTDIIAGIDSAPLGIVSDPTRDVLWFAEAGAGQLARISTGGVITEWGIPGNGTTAVDVALGPDSSGGSMSADLWFTNSDVLQIGDGTNDVGKANISLLPSSVRRKTFDARVMRGRLRLVAVHGPGLFKHHLR